MINKINRGEKMYYTQAMNPTFTSKIIPHKDMKMFLSDKNIFLENGIKRQSDLFRKTIYTAKTTLNCTDKLLNDGKNDIYEYTNKTLKVNGKKITPKKIEDSAIQILQNDEFKDIKNAIEKLRADFKADHEAKNVMILENLCNNIKQIDDIIFNSAKEMFEKINKQI